MRIISKSRLKRFWEELGHAEAEGALRAWYMHVGNKSVAWQSWGDVKAEIGTASSVGKCAVSNIGGNKYRLITRILYPSQKVFVLKVMTHEEYDRNTWKEECGCYEAPPKKPKGQQPKPAGKPKPSRKER